ncbi:MAG: protein kinase, partial [Polyangiaceae bacterium]|nr:protein kinase [Polyangiaceae bacterium]
MTDVVAVTPETPGAFQTSAGEIFGTLGYMAPEQARGDVERVDRRSDVFSLGAILCEILTGQPPFFGPPETLRIHARDGKLLGAYLLLDRCGADPSLVLLAKQCLAAEPDARPADAGILAQMLARCLDNLQTKNQ